MSRTAGPRLGFLGTGWIGRLRLQSLIEAGVAEIAALADPSPDELAEARRLAPDAQTADGLDGLLEMDLDGIVIATPSALHAGQSVRALEAGRAVFCQKPLARTAAEALGVVEAARRNDKLLAVDFSYRRVKGIAEIRQLIRAGELGRVFALDLTFHNAYGPDKPWFYDVAQAGGGCLMDLGSHLVDLGLWLTDFAPVQAIRAHLYAQGEPLTRPVTRAEDFALAELELEGGTVLRLACSWNLAAGRDAVIELGVHGSQGGAALRNVNGSFFDFQVERYFGTRTETLVSPPDDWGGRALIQWARQLAEDPGFDPAADRLVAVHRVLDGIYGR